MDNLTSRSNFLADDSMTDNTFQKNDQDSDCYK